MDDKRASILEELAGDAGRRRDEFLTDAGRQFVRFLDANKSRLKDLGGLVLIDDEPDYLFVSEDGTFRSRTRYQDEAGKWVSEAEDIESGADLVELFNPADLYAAFIDAAEAEVESSESDEAEDEVSEAAERADRRMRRRPRKPRKRRSTSGSTTRPWRRAISRTPPG